MSHVCADCGHETDKQKGPCDKCFSFRIVLISFVAKVFGEDWRDCFKEEKDGSNISNS
jgi:predicted ATP-dependent serine protease